MRSLPITILLLGLSLPSLGFAQMTANAARTMPLEALAQQLLGASGRIMIGVERPRFQGILEPILFYSRASVTGSQFGLCGSDWVTVSFDDSGNVDDLSSQSRFGVAGDIYRAPGRWSDSEYAKICDAVKSTKSYFPAPNAQAALEIAWYVDAISGKGPYSQQDFAYTCTGACSTESVQLSWLRLQDVDAAQTIDCPKTTFKAPSCYKLTVGQGRMGAFPKVYRIYGSCYMNKVVVWAVSVDVSFTIQ